MVIWSLAENAHTVHVPVVLSFGCPVVELGLVTQFYSKTKQPAIIPPTQESG